MLVSEVAAQLAGDFEKWDDYEFNQRVISNVVVAYAETVRQDINKHGKLIPAYLYEIKSTEMEEVDVTETDNLELDCFVFRTKCEIPEVVSTRRFPTGYQYVGTIDGKRGFTFSEPEKLPYIMNSVAFRRKPAFWYKNNNRIYVYGDRPDYLRIRGIFSDPRKLSKCEVGNDSDSRCLSNDFDIDEDLVHRIKRIAYSYLQQTIIRPQEDEIEIKDRVNESG